MDKYALIALSSKELTELRDLVDYAAKNLNIMEQTKDLRTKINSIELDVCQKVSVDTDAGKITAWIDEGMHGPQAGIEWAPDNETPVDLFYVENYKEEDGYEGCGPKDAVSCYTYEDITTEDWTHCFEISKKDALEAMGE